MILIIKKEWSCFGDSVGNYNDILAILKSAMLTRLKIAHVPPSSLFARCCLIYLKYTCSKSRKTAARRIPIISKRNALKNCSNARGSLLFCTSLPGLHVPVIQYLLNRSKSPRVDGMTLEHNDKFVKKNL